MSRAAGPGAGAGLRRFVREPERPAPGEHCEMCAQPVEETHSHVADLAKRSVMCACRGCALLFTERGAAGGRYLTVPTRYLHDPDFTAAAGVFEELQIPVGMAFFLYNSEQERTVALYPSPAGATESLLPVETAEAVTGSGAAIAFTGTEAAADVEAVLVRRRDAAEQDAGAYEGFLVPVDTCYRLVGLVRSTWKGFDGGQAARRALDGFFAELRERSRRVGPADPGAAAAACRDGATGEGASR
ncbi:DUF5947 family protein [Streptomonospora litoralis]|uniref:Uncharacterized protein n=1 Tax=Streptomonospora litoralis TaxID=2498135 RepID=A0A4P6Q0F8_9ACTN|nr:DUF5947 family protein [Streptomonospora litoralis]QBI53550.1 hypothetical protein EKD16_08780 [Streptomonospora litoralis]